MDHADVVERLCGPLELGVAVRRTKKCLHFSICACHPCAGAMLLFSVSFQFYRMISEENPLRPPRADGKWGGSVQDWAWARLRKIAMTLPGSVGFSRLENLLSQVELLRLPNRNPPLRREGHGTTASRAERGPNPRRGGRSLS